MGTAEFCAVSWCLGHGQGDYMWVRQEIIKELNTQKDWYVTNNFLHNFDGVSACLAVDLPEPCGTSKWMSMPSMGDVMANAFSRPVFFFSTGWLQNKRLEGKSHSRGFAMGGQIFQKSAEVE
ncbi:hypothetical protein PSTG_00415 [Puccinia striiformis f. sp. tritici PST-78]|uniref:Uncharacterized protein n=1 Tax=Puccinia striiformis f. sp. tritici PST-78 TaxID=1165861 RepID=A0A0L0W4U5_9BASI|nr:hypothetical protein PSTG_00415 [Puccinia striiformis f. sp. tritici PST-78]